MLLNHIYIVKPIHKLTLHSAIDGVCKINKKVVAEEDTKCFIIKGKFNTKIDVPLSSIVYIEQDKHYCKINTANKQFNYLQSLVKLMDELDDRFLRIHRTYCINVNYIEKFDANLLCVKVAGKELPIGRICRVEVRKFIAEKYLKIAVDN